MTNDKHKNRNYPSWIWLIFLLFTSAVVLWIFTGDGEYNILASQDQGNAIIIQDTIDGKESLNAKIGAILTYSKFIEENGNMLAENHVYSHRALTYLAFAVEEIAQENNIEEQNLNEIDNLKYNADWLIKEQNPSKHSSIIANAFNSAAEVINNVQDEEYPKLEQQANDLLQAANNINPDEEITTQKEEVQSFFEKSALTLGNMQAGSANVSMNTEY